MQTKFERTGTLNAIDADGNRYMIVKYTEFYLERKLDGTLEKFEGQNMYQLLSGETVHKISDSEYYAIVSNVQLFVRSP